MTSVSKRFGSKHVARLVLAFCTLLTVLYVTDVFRTRAPQVSTPKFLEKIVLQSDEDIRVEKSLRLLQREETYGSPAQEVVTPEGAKLLFEREWQRHMRDISLVSIDNKPLTALMQPYLDYKFDLPPRALQKSLVYKGPNYGMRRFMHKLLTGTEETVKVSLIGGSIAWGAAAERGKEFFAVVQQYMETAFPHMNFEFRNGAVPATPSAFMNLCLELSMDEDVDLVMIEYVPNDGTDIRDASRIRNYERLVRKVLKKEKMPALVLVQLTTNGMGFSPSHPGKNPFYKTVEDMYGAVAQYYDLPWLSFRNAIWRYAEFHKHGMNHTIFFGDHDYFHPLDFGHKVIGDMIVYLMQNTIVDLFMHPYSDADEDFFQDGVPVPMYPGNYEGLNRLCLHGEATAKVVMDHDGWQMVNEGDDIKPKIGYVSNTINSTLRFKLNTTRAGKSSGSGETMNVLIAYLRSYVDMGMAEIRCEKNCRCQPSKVQALHSFRQSTLFMARSLPSQHDECVMSVTVLEKTESKGHKFKISGIMMNEYTGADQMVTMGREMWAGQMQVINKNANDKADKVRRRRY